MDAGQLQQLRTRLGGRTKRDLILDMITHSPHDAATEKTVLALEAFPMLLLLLAHDHPTKIWILDRGEKPSSARILSDEVRARRWHTAGIGVDDCEGITDVVDDYIAVVTSWKTLLLMRHEFAHASTTFLSPRARKQLEQLYHAAQTRNQFTEPLAAESLGEYVACGLSYYCFPDLRDELRAVDPALFRLVEHVLGQAEAVSQQICPPAPVTAATR